MNKLFKKIALVLAFAMVFTAMPMSVFAEGNPCADGHQYNPNYYWSTEEQSHRHACDRCGFADEEYLHEDTNPVDGKCDVCEVTVANDGDNNYIHTHNFTVVNSDSKWHWYHCEDEKCMQTDGWEEHSEPRTDSDGNIDFAIGPMGHNYYCAVCDEQYGAELHVPGEGLMPVYDPDGKEGHAAMCMVCTAPAILTFEEHIPMLDGEGNPMYGCDDNDHFEICSICWNGNESTKKAHTPGEDWVLFDETSHVKTCAVCWGEVPSVKENHTAPDEHGECSQCHIPVDSTGKHIHDVNNVWRIEYAEHVKRCNICGRAVEMDFHSDANGDKKCDVCNAIVEAVTEDGVYIDYVHNHQETGVWSFDDESCHVMHCVTCGEGIDWQEHADAAEDGICDVCNGVYMFVVSLGENSKTETAINNDIASVVATMENAGTIESYVAEAVKNALTSGKEVKVLSNPVANILSDDDLEALSNANDEGLIGLAEYLEAKGIEDVLSIMDINYGVQFVIENSSPSPEYLLTELPEAVEFTITLPDYIQAPQGQKTVWTVYRYHNGTVDELYVTENGNGTGTFKTDKFSLYILGYEFVDAGHSHIWGYNTQYDAAAHWDYCHICGEKGAFVSHSDEDHNGYCICGWKITTTSGRQNPATGVTAEMLG